MCHQSFVRRYSPYPPGFPRRRFGGNLANHAVNAASTQNTPIWAPRASIGLPRTSVRNGGSARVLRGSLGHSACCRPSAHARPPREMRHRPVGILAPGQVRARRARLLTRIPPAPLRPPGRRGPSGLVIQRRRQRGIAGIPRCGTLQPRQPLLQLAGPPGQRRVLHRQHGDELALQRDQRVTGSIQRPGSHRPPSSGQVNGNQAGTLSRLPEIITGGGNPDTH